MIVLAIGFLLERPDKLLRRREPHDDPGSSWRGQRDAAVVFCTDATCSAEPIKIVVDNEASAEQLALAVDAAGNAYVSYYDAAAGGLRFAYGAAP
jgi:hypothetical protein